MPVIIKSKHATPLTLPFPLRGILPPGGAVILDLTQEEALEVLAVASVSGLQNVVSVTDISVDDAEISVTQQGNAESGLLLDLTALFGTTVDGVNVGAGIGVFKDKTGTTLNFKSLLAGTGVTIVATGADEVTISASAGSGEANLGANVGGGDGIFRDKTGITLNLKSLLAGTNISLTPAADTVSISTTAEINTGSNVGTGNGVFRDKTGTTINLKSLKAGANVTLTPSADEIEIASAAPGETNTAANVGAGDGVFRDKIGTTINFRSIIGGTGVTVTPAANDLTLSTTGEANTAANVGAGDGVFRDKTGTTINLKSLTAGSNITLTPSADEVEIAGPAPGETNLGANVGTGDGVFKDKTGSTLNFKTIKAGTNITLTPSTNEILIDASGAGEANLAANVGAGDGIFRDKTGVTLNLKTITAGANITLTPSADELEIAAAAGGGPPDEVLVSSKSNLPTPAAGVITLDDNKRYRIIGTIALGTDRITLGINSPLLGRSSKFDELTYTGTGNMLTVPSSAVEGLIENVKLSATSGTALDVNGPANFALHGVEIDAGIIGDVDTTTSVDITDLVAAGFGVGLSFSGTGSRLTMHNAVLIQTTGGSSNPVIDLGSATFDSVRMLTVRAVSASGGVGLTGLASGGNINSGGTAVVNDSDLNGPGTSLSTITVDDIQWIFSRVIGVVDSEVVGYFRQNAGAATTAINGPTKLTITTTAGALRRMTSPVTNRLLYNDLQDRQATACVNLLIQKVSGGDFVVDIGVAVNGTIVGRIIEVEVGATQEAVAFTFPIPASLKATDTIEIFGDNTGGSQDASIQSASLAVRAK